MPSQTEPALSTRQIETVLIVDDDAGVVRALVRRLRSLGKDAFGVLSGEEALASARTHQPQLAVVDLFMPQRDGISTIKALRALDQDMAIVLTSAALDPMHVAAAMNAGAVECVDKPFDMSNLIRRIEGHDSFPPTLDARATLAEAERFCMIRALVDTKGNRSAAARRLGITRCGLQKKLKKSVGEV